MKNKEASENKAPQLPRPLPKAKPKSLRPMRSLVATRSMKPKTMVANLTMKPDELGQSL
jgi:hypothetical protein